MCKKSLVGVIIMLILLSQLGFAAPIDFIADAPASQTETSVRPSYFTQLSQLRMKLEEQETKAALRHMVVRGETLSMIAKRYGVKLDELITLNRIQNPNVIHPGQVVLLASDEKAASDKPETQTYTVVRGDTIWALAKRYKIDMQSIIAANNITDPRSLEIGQQLTIPSSVVPAVSTTRVVASRSTPASASSGTITVTATAYCAGIAATGCPINSKGHSVCTGSYSDGITASGMRAVAGDGSEGNPHIVAVDPRVFPLGTLLYIDGYGYAIAADTGGAIKGNRLDILLPTHQAALQFGRRQLTVRVVSQ